MLLLVASLLAIIASSAIRAEPLQNTMVRLAQAVLRDCQPDLFQFQDLSASPLDNAKLLASFPIGETQCRMAVDDMLTYVIKLNYSPLYDSIKSFSECQKADLNEEKRSQCLIGSIQTVSTIFQTVIVPELTTNAVIAFKPFLELLRAMPEYERLAECVSEGESGWSIPPETMALLEKSLSGPDLTDFINNIGTTLANMPCEVELVTFLTALTANHRSFPVFVASISKLSPFAADMFLIEDGAPCAHAVEDLDLLGVDCRTPFYHIVSNFVGSGHDNTVHPRPSPCTNLDALLDAIRRATATTMAVGAVICFTCIGIVVYKIRSSNRSSHLPLRAEDGFGPSELKKSAMAPYYSSLHFDGGHDFDNEDGEDLIPVSR